MLKRPLAFSSPFSLEQLQFLSTWSSLFSCLGLITGSLYSIVLPFPLGIVLNLHPPSHTPTRPPFSSPSAYNPVSIMEGTDSIMGELLALVFPIPSLTQNLTQADPNPHPLSWLYRDWKTPPVGQPSLYLRSRSHLLPFLPVQAPLNTFSAWTFPFSPLGFIPSAHGPDQVSSTLKNNPLLLLISPCSYCPNNLASSQQSC